MRESEEETESTESVSNVYDWREEGVEEGVRLATKLVTARRIMHAF